MESYELFPDTQIILIPDSVMMINRASKDFSVIFFYFTRQFFEDAHRQIDPSFFHHLKDFPVYHHTPSSAKLVGQVFSLIAATYYDMPNRFRTAIVANHLRNFLLNAYDKIQRNVTGIMTESYKRKEELYHRFIELILKNCTQHRDVEFYADKLCISKRYLAAITHETVGETPKFTIDKHVVQEIKTTLTFSGMPLEQIAEYLNFPDQSYMGRYFKRHTGHSPLKYRSFI
jgi:AraC-like DNA-binding protein